MIDFNKLNLTEGMDPIEQSASDKAVESGQQKKDPSRITRQKSQMAQQAQMKTKSNVVYTSEAIDRLKAFNRQKSDWREEMDTQAQVREEKEVDPEHPYVDVMPMTNGNEKRAKEQMKLAKKVGLTNAKTAIATGMTTEGYKEFPHKKVMDKVQKKRDDEKSVEQARKMDRMHGAFRQHRGNQDKNLHIKAAKEKEAENKARGKMKEDFDFDKMFGDLVERELSIDQQMKMAREAGKKRNPNPDHKAIRGKMLQKALPKDTRTDAQKMTDATGPRPGSRYRGD